MKPDKTAPKTDFSDLVSDRNYNLWLLFQSTRDALTAVRAKYLREGNLSNIESAVLLLIQLIERAENVFDKTLLFLSGSIRKMRLCIKGKEAQYMGMRWDVSGWRFRTKPAVIRRNFPVYV